jgi:RNA polymerase sigma-70 factor, ECF subfamily
LQSIGTLRDPTVLKSWLTSVAVLTAKTWIQRRQRRKWLHFLPTEELPEREAPQVSGEVREAFRATYLALAELPADERLAFSLRFIDGMDITDVAASCRVSLSTIKRRLAKAEQLFRKAARKHPVLMDWLAGDSKWNNPMNS